MLVPLHLSTPPTSLMPRNTTGTPSDDSSIIELSFDYEFDSNGNYVRVSKGSNDSVHSTPPTPQDCHEPSPNGMNIKPASPALFNSPRRGSLSRSESYPIMSQAEVRVQPAPVVGSNALRSFQRVASGPTLSNIPTPASTRANAPMNNGLRGTARKVRALGAQRVTIEQYREMDEKNRLEDEELRAKGEHPAVKEEWEREHKENISNTEGNNPNLIVLNPISKQRPSGLSPRLSSRSTSASQTDRITSALPSRASTSTSKGRQIFPGPSRAGRILMGTKYAASTSQPSEFDKINEIDPASDNDCNAVVDFYGRDDLDSGVDDQPPNNSAKHKSHAGIPSSSAGSLSQSGNTRPRRSASLSDALTEERLSTGALPGSSSSSSNQYLATGRPVSSLGISGSNANVNAARARRVTMEEKYKMERDKEAELDEYERKLMEHAAEQERRHYEAHQQQTYRKSPSPTHLSLATQPSAHTLLRTHNRRDSDTLRSLLPSSSSQSNFASPTAVERNYKERGDNLSPPSRNFNGTALGSSQTRSGYNHKRSPTAPDPVTTSGMLGPPGVSTQGKGQTWTVGDDVAERERDMRTMEKSREREEVVRNAPSQSTQSTSALRPTSVPAPQPTNQPVAPATRHITVNKKIYARLDLVGKGGSSRVYRVMTARNEVFAIKRVNLDQTDAETMSGYMNEIALLKRLDGNSRIIKLVDSEVKAGPGGSKGNLLLVMECGEIDLARLLQEQQKEPVNMVWVSYYWQQMLQAVHVIHEEKIVHSDLKPANFVLVRGQLKLIDFGIANAIANDTTNIQRDHQIGTANYMSPEAIELPDGMRRLKVGRPSDIWSLGCILYQMVYGHPPFQHLSNFQKMKAIPDLTYIIDFPQYATPSIPTRTSGGTGSGSTTPPKKLDHLKRRVRGDVIMSMKSCLYRNPKERATIPELLDQDWLAMKEVETPAENPKPQLGPDETVINPYYMSQLLAYGIKLGQQSQNEELPPDDLLKEAERLVAELKALEP